VTVEIAFLKRENIVRSLSRSFCALFNKPRSPAAKMTNSEHSNNNNNSYDLFKDSPMRYLGYTNELGEAFRAFIPKSVVLATYAIATAYAMGDAVDKGYKAYTQPSSPFTTTTPTEDGSVDDVTTTPLNNNNNSARNWHVAERTTDTAIWQLLASVTVPAYIINRVVHATNWSLNRFVHAGSAWRGRGMFKMIPTLAGLAVIPILPHALDPVIDLAMDNTTRPLFKTLMEKNLQQQRKQQQTISIEGESQ